MWCILVMVMAGSRFTSGVWLCALLLESTHVTFNLFIHLIWKAEANISMCRLYVLSAHSTKLLHKGHTHVDVIILVFYVLFCRIQIGKAASVKTAATLVRELSYQNKV
jgi:hypothetical protein